MAESDEKQTEVLIVAKAFETFVNTLVVIKKNALLKPATLEKLDVITNTILDKFVVAVTDINIDFKDNSNNTIVTTDVTNSTNTDTNTIK